ncbi:hypothetical protein SCHPADRAFT_89618 [Schizopora paradoxa]|uniref:DUF6533 domain-containing protein n=1 Tax=Schizopora paradoxa TaxID=27342 RepID=A0A0H2SPT4_9AGAM|nr:hypothetical protein SCHPADRAFT_89618 [Schizopora paradoxa]
MDQLPNSVLGPILVQAVQQGTGTKYAFMAGFTLFLYDHLLTLNDEIELIWKKKFSASASQSNFRNHYCAVSDEITF